MKFYRLCAGIYATLLDGEGSRLYGGRWNSKGTPMIYTSSSRALAMSEALVNLRPDHLPENYKMIELYIPDAIAIDEIDPRTLTKGWNNELDYDPIIQIIGDDFYKRGKYLVLRVPSAVVKGDYNYLINPRHADAAKITIVSVEDFPFDKRLFLK